MKATPPTPHQAPEQASGRQARPADPARLLTAVERAVTARLTAALAEADCTPEEWRVLDLLADGQGHPMTEIAEYALLPPPTLTKLIDRMVAANRVYRRVDDADRRRVLVLLAERGHTAHRRAAGAAARAWHTVTDALGPEEAALLSALLARATTRLT
ncbi:MarR family winged helix-turn-helix transcriptional regulator [Actinomadura kijaniata]|uniref:MarR family winged helix-turn-helix transcriptional regulator n=1 Tax=Actinomadura kijaniata TaxID=46161 RepID=UPI0008338312|nr:MarR family winged helix-turn-helix transcriptional regulator [Actinomadura kijaniata]